MLVLRRKVGESIILDGVISISVLAVEGERVKIGINAPPDVTIVREELLRVLAADTAHELRNEVVASRQCDVHGSQKG